MSTFEIKLDRFHDDRLEVDVSPSEEELRELFEAFEEDFRITGPEEFVAEITAIRDGETIILTGEVAGEFDYTCGRCLTERSLEVRSPVNFEVMSRDEWESHYTGEEEIALEADDLDTDYYEGHSIDLRPYIRDAITLELPQWPQCPDEFRDECDEAYEEHVGDETLDKLEEHSIDLRWWPLKDIELENDGEDDTNETDQSTNASD